MISFLLLQSYVQKIVTEPNSVHMLWIVPQFVVLTLGEVMYSVTGLEFSYSQSPESMKSVIQSAWQLTVGVGNLIVVIITGAKIFDSQVRGEEILSFKIVTNCVSFPFFPFFS